MVLCSESNANLLYWMVKLEQKINNHGRAFEMILDWLGYYDFERGDVDTYSFELPETARYSDIKVLIIRKGYINIDGNWKEQHDKVVDQADHFCLTDKAIKSGRTFI